MNRAIVPAILIGLAAAGVAVFALKDGKLAGIVPAALSGDPVWSVENKAGPIGENPTLTATQTQNDDNGGSVFITATCDDSTISFDFEYHAKQDDDAHSRLETQGTGEYVHVPYRIDDGEIKEAISQTNHTNTADALFAYEMSDAAAPAQPGEVIAKGVGKLISGLIPGLGPQDLRAFLHAQNVRFEIPVADGTKDVVVVRPQENTFQSFVSACRIDLKRFDDDVARQQQAEKAAAEAKAKAQADADALQKAQQDAATLAAQQRSDALRQACTAGQGELRVTQTVNLEGSSSTTWVFSGQMVQASPDPDAVAAGKCSVSFARGNGELSGQLPLSALEVADNASAPAPDAGTGDSTAPAAGGSNETPQ